MGARGPKPSCDCGTCPKCLRRASEKRWRDKTPETQRGYRERRREYQRQYREARRAELNARDLARYRDDVGGERAKHNARGAVRRALKRGDLTRLPCEQCGATDNVEAHHDDYARPLEVRWLCRRHHIDEHLREAA